MREMFKRVVFVLYITGWLLGIVLVGFSGWGQKPYQTVDEEKSIVTCNTNSGGTTNSFSLKSIDVTLYGDKDSYTDKTTDKINLEPYNNQKVYEGCINTGVKTLGLEDKTIGSWNSVLKTWIGGFGILWIILEVIKGTIFYIVFGNWQGTYKNKGERR